MLPTRGRLARDVRSQRVGAHERSFVGVRRLSVTVGAVVARGGAVPRVAPVKLLGLGVHPVRRAELIDLLSSWAARAASSRPRRMYYTNAHVFNLAQDDARFRQSLNNADLLICEGWGGRIGGWIAGAPLPEQLATMDWMDDFLPRLAADGRSLFLLGDEPGVADACALQMVRRHPGLEIAGTHHGFFDKGPDGSRAVIERVHASGADVLFVGLGNPLQEFWIDDHLETLDVPLVLALGAMFRWYSGVERRAPSWMRRLHLEWLHRLARHPIRHFRRYVIGNPLFLLRCLGQRMERGRSGVP